MLHVRTFGEGRPVLALHGVTAHGARWRVLAEHLPELRIHGVDLRGHGRSPWTPPWAWNSTSPTSPTPWTRWAWTASR